MESFYIKYKSFNWDEIIRHRLTSYRNAARYGRKKSFNDYSDSQKYYYLETQKCIAAQREIIIFGSKRQQKTSWKLIWCHHICLTITQQQKSCVIMDKDCSQSQCLSISPLQRIPSLGNTMLKTWIFFCIKFNILSKKDDSGQRCW